jgi:hypothetical protein
MLAKEARDQWKEAANVVAFMASDYASTMTAAIANATCGYIVD